MTSRAPISRARRRRTLRRDAAIPAIIAQLRAGCIALVVTIDGFPLGYEGFVAADGDRVIECGGAGDHSILRASERSSPATPRLSDLADDRGHSGAARRRAGGVWIADGGRGRRPIVDTSWTYTKTL
jgi:hypothetical protein